MKYNNHIYEIIHAKIDPWIMQCPHKTKDEIFIDMLRDMDNNITFPLEKDDMVFYMMPETPWLAKLNVFSDTKNAKQALTSAIYLTDYMFENMKTLRKIYGISPHKKFVRMINKIGWKQEGVLSESFLDKNGDMVDQYVFGVTRDEFKLR
jgi:hypothetical protein